MLATDNSLGWMSRQMQWAGIAFCLGMVLCLAGCSICPSPYDYDYGTYGTKTPRTNMRQGRVGSILSESVYGTSQAVSAEGFAIEGQIIEEGYLVEPYDAMEQEPIQSGEIIIQ
jgi:hypothetical protein